jgi:hypothetical protein
MNDSNEFTTFYFDYNIYNSNKIKLKKIINNYGMKWNNGKMKLEISWDELLESFKFFKCDDKIISDKNLVGRTGSVGLWESSKEAVKIITIDKKDESEHLPVLLVHRGEEGEFYKDFIKTCVPLGCEIGKIVETEEGFEVLFKKRINVDLVEKLGNIELNKDTMKENFMNKIEELKKHGHEFSDDFVVGWIRCIYKYGYYSLNDLLAEIGNRKRLEGDNMIHNDLAQDNIHQASFLHTTTNEHKPDDNAAGDSSPVAPPNLSVFKKKTFIIKMKKNVTEG